MKLTFGPRLGAAPPIFVQTVIAQSESWSHGRRYPENESRKVVTRSSTPMTQLNSRGGLYEPVKNTRAICRKTEMTIPCAAQRCILRISVPNVTDEPRSFILS